MLVKTAVYALSKTRMIFAELAASATTAAAANAAKAKPTHAWNVI